ncbi:eukaryotic type KH-domain (KH-domain type I) [Amniculicola lignicola CBS 123094]|uniref:Eukaryotic type KH-domain (KH-domain type I) n=1 Tax=Amniculicola lignicola CBS 123094 TaxID=1392246 RepID=A0A6A5X4E1_9PLEO|nr:eukaryotic type KH-domain (KH-domain type I) [Amniculicola lignicola CBS 123094]
MSASPTIAASSTKRPLEEPSSPAGQHEQPDAKRPALDKAVKEEVVPDDTSATETVNADNDPTDPAKSDETVKEEEDNKAGQQGVPENSDPAEGGAVAGQDTYVPDAPVNSGWPGQQPQPIQSMAGANGRFSSSAHGQHQDETNWLHIRSCISTTEAATIIGKGGENVSEIRKMAGAKCTISDYARGAVERILTVSGPVDAVSKAFGLIVRTLNQEDLVQPSTSQSKAYPMRLLIPHILIGSIIGKGGVRIREIQDASNAKLNASDTMLPNSGERSLVILGVADAVHIAVYYVAQTLVEQLTERFGGPAASQYATRSGTAANVVPGGMSVQPYQMQPYGQGSPNRGGYGNVVPAGPQPGSYGAPPAAGPVVGHPQAPHQPNQMPGQPLTQQIYIPNDMVGAIIGKGGAKINEIRTLSGSVIKINEPTSETSERLVTITGTQECNQMALYMLYQRLGESKVQSPPRLTKRHRIREASHLIIRCLHSLPFPISPMLCYFRHSFEKGLKSMDLCAHRFPYPTLDM